MSGWRRSAASEESAESKGHSRNEMHVGHRPKWVDHHTDKAVPMLPKWMLQPIFKLVPNLHF